MTDTTPAPKLNWPKGLQWHVAALLVIWLMSEGIVGCILQVAHGIDRAFYSKLAGMLIGYVLFFRAFFSGKGLLRYFFIFGVGAAGYAGELISDIYSFFTEVESEVTVEGVASALDRLGRSVLYFIAFMGFWKIREQIAANPPRELGGALPQHVLPALAVMVLCQLQLQGSLDGKRSILARQQPVIAEIILRDAVTQKPLSELRLMSSKDAPQGWNETFNKRHHAFCGSTMIGNHPTSFLKMKTAIAEPLKLRFGSDGYEPAEVIIQPGHEGRIELVLKPVAEKTKP